MRTIRFLSRHVPVTELSCEGSRVWLYAFMRNRLRKANEWGIGIGLRKLAVQLRIEWFEDTTVLRNKKLRNKPLRNRHTRTKANAEEPRVSSSPAMANSSDVSTRA